MLVLKRKVGEAIRIGDDIEIIVLDKEGDTVKIGINAPRSLKVFRKEIYDEIKNANRSAMQLPQFEELLHFYQQQSKNDEK
ncbi:MAG: carbon storage regulator CsrA [Tumebacillaceae bacterium]